MTEAFKVVIPARYASTRLPGKPLINIAGKPMIAHVCERAKEAQAIEVVVATDDQRIYAAVTDLGIHVVMTRKDHLSGTERIAEVAQQCGWKESDIIVNLQGDEPLIAATYIRSVAQSLASQSIAGIATLAAKIEQWEEVFNPNTVKVVTDKQGYALYFSRAAIPWDRENFKANHANKSLTAQMSYLRHIGIYAYRVGFLNRYVGWDASPLEAVESLEQLRILWQGESILVNKVSTVPPPGVDTKEDLIRVEKILLENRSEVK
jgi:3-deoxy-manno-octulosonate cytidylyltransferase (CMP-KDO synthetase)